MNRMLIMMMFANVFVTNISVHRNMLFGSLNKLRRKTLE